MAAGFVAGGITIIDGGGSARQFQVWSSDGTINGQLNFLPPTGAGGRKTQQFALDGTLQQLSVASVPLISGVTLFSAADPILLGYSNADTQGVLLAALQPWSLSAQDLDEIWVQGTNGDTAYFSCS